MGAGHCVAVAGLLQQYSLSVHAEVAVMERNSVVLSIYVGQALAINTPGKYLSIS